MSNINNAERSGIDRRGFLGAITALTAHTALTPGGVFNAAAKLLPVPVVLSAAERLSVMQGLQAFVAAAKGAKEIVDARQYFGQDDKTEFEICACYACGEPLDESFYSELIAQRVAEVQNDFSSYHAVLKSVPDKAMALRGVLKRCDEMSQEAFQDLCEKAVKRIDQHFEAIALNGGEVDATDARYAEQKKWFLSQKQVGLGLENYHANNQVSFVALVEGDFAALYNPTLVGSYCPGSDSEDQIQLCLDISNYRHQVGEDYKEKLKAYLGNVGFEGQEVSDMMELLRGRYHGCLNHDWMNNFRNADCAIDRVKKTVEWYRDGFEDDAKNMQSIAEFRLEGFKHVRGFEERVAELERRLALRTQLNFEYSWPPKNDYY